MSTMHYVASIPRKLPAGRVLVHNDVVRQNRLGSNGFRAWTQPLDAEPALGSCGCGWSGLLHYRMKHERHPAAPIEITMSGKYVLAVAPSIFKPMSAHRSSSLITFGLGASGPSAPRKPNNQSRNGADDYSLQQPSEGLSLQD
jgi:hypothetical protein